MPSGMRTAGRASCAGLVAAVALLLVSAPPRAAEPVAALPVELQFVPPDALAFAHINFEELWKSPFGRTLAKLKLSELDLKFVSEVYGLTPDDIRTATLYVTELPDDDELRFAMVLTTVKEYDRKVVIGGVERSQGVLNGKFENKDNIIRVVPERGSPMYLDLTDPKRIVLGSNLKADPKADPKRAAGVHTATLKTPGAVLLAGFNPAALPEDIRGEKEKFAGNFPELMPLVRSDSLAVVGTLTAKELTVTATVRSPKKEVAAGVAKSLESFRPEVGKLLDAEVKELDALEQFGDDVKEYRPLFKMAGAVLKAGTIKTDGTTTTATLAVPTDLPFGPYLDLLTGGRPTKLEQFRSQIKSIMLGLHNCHDESGAFPPPYLTSEKGKPLLSWRVAVLPMMGEKEKELFEKFKLDEPWDSEHNAKVLKDNPMPDVFLFPGDKAEDKKTRFRVFVGNGAGFEAGKKGRIADITDGTSNTVAFVTAATAVPWTKPEELAFDPKKDMKPLLHFHADRCYLALFDGSARSIPKGVTEVKLKAAITRAGGEVENLDE